MPHKPSRWLLIAAFAAIYVIWGSSYIGIHFAIQTLPPFLMTGSRFVVAGGALIVWALLRGTPLPTRVNWRAALIAGLLLFLLNNGGIVWAEANGVPTGIVAVLIATVPMWIVLMTWLKPGGSFPGGMVIAGLVSGFIGIILLFDPSGVVVNPVGVGVVLGAAFCWAIGSLYLRSAPLPQSGALSTGMQLFCGGVLQVIAGAFAGDFAAFDPAQVSAQSLIAVIYLAVVSSVIAYSAYVWLMRVSTPARVATYAYINPVVAVFLGWLLAGEALTLRTVIGAGIIIASVIMINGSSSASVTRFKHLLRRATEPGRPTTDAPIATTVTKG